MARAALAAAIIVALLPAAVEARGSMKHARSRGQYWQVGVLDVRLSAACRRGEFNQRRAEHLFIGHRADDGAGITGIAKAAWNLRDPRQLARPGLTYHFFNDGYSSCRVFTARERRGGGRSGRSGTGGR